MTRKLELVCIIDQSGSMAGLESDTIGGINALIQKQKKITDGDVIVSIILFNHKQDVLYNRVPIKDVPLLDHDQYIVGGSTALLDAVGGAIEHTTKVHALLGGQDTPEQTMFVITTDGYENASKKYTNKQIKRMISERQEFGWEFMFLGANIDAYDTARQYGMKESNVSQYVHDSEGVAVAYESLNMAVSDLRASKKIRASWKDRVEKDYKKRSK